MLPVLRMLPLLYQLAVLTAIFAPVSYASSNGMDMSADGAMPLAQGEMLSYLHFTPGDTLWFMGWVPASAGAMVGTCIGLFLLALVERWIAASRAVMEIHWNKRAHIIQSNRLNGVHLPIITSESKSKTLPLPPTSASQQGRLTTRSFPPFILTHDVTRGILYLAKTAINFAFMLAVMTFQLGFIFAIVVGLGVGEMLFGRYASHAAHLA
ncbi:hypothetical protein AcW1_001992 [Taiwanofungus camphoratus]|nr:hypothetical protein AcW1_001992 [Antrodia cinnamomea]